MADIIDIVARTAIGSDVLRVYANAVVSVYYYGTTTLVTQVTADADGNWSIDTLTEGKYDLKVDGQLLKTIHFVPANKPIEQWNFFFDGNQTIDRNEDQDHPVFYTPVAGDVIAVRVLAERASSTGDATVHLMVGDSGGSGALTFASDSEWSHQINPGGGSTTYRVAHNDPAPGFSLTAGQAMAAGIDVTTSGVEGINITIFFRPD